MEFKPAFYYTDMADYINKFTYPVRVPVHTIPQSPWVRDGIIDPPWTPDSPNDMVESRATINDMLKFVETRTDFIIEQDPDVPSILHSIDRYLRSKASLMENGNLEVIRYAHRLLALRTMIYEFAFLRVLNKNPYMKRAYEGEKDDIIMLLALCPMADVSKRLTDPIEALRYPDVKIPPLPNKQKTTSFTPGSIEDLTEQERILNNHTRREDRPINPDPLGGFSM